MHHLIEASRTFDAHQILKLETADGENALWSETETRSDTGNFLAAVALVQGVAITAGWEQVRKEAPAMALAPALRYALYCASVRSFLSAIPYRLLARAASLGVLDPGQARTYARQLVDPGQRAIAYAELHVFFTGSAREELVAGTFQAVREIALMGESARLDEVAAALPTDAFSELLGIVESFPDSAEKSAVFAAAARRSPNLLPFALAHAYALDHPGAQAMALVNLLPLLRGATRKEATEATLRGGLEFPRARPDSVLSIGPLERLCIDALEAVVPHLARPQINLVATAAEEIPGDDDRIRILAALARSMEGHGREEFIARALSAAGDGISSVQRARVLAPVIPLLPQRQANKILHSGWLWAGSEAMADTLVAAAPWMYGPTMATYLNRARRLRTKPDKARALTAIVRQLTDAERAAVVAEAWRLVRDLTYKKGSDEFTLHRLLGDLAPYMDASGISDALAITRGIRDADRQEEVASKIDRYLTPDLAADALAAIERSTEPRSAERLIALAETLPAEKVPEALQLARRMDSLFTAAAMATLAARLPEPMREPVLREILKRKDATQMGEGAFATIAPLLSEALRDEILAQMFAPSKGISMYRPERLEILAPFLSFRQLSNAVAAAGRQRQLTGEADNDENRQLLVQAAHTLSYLAVALPDELVPEAVEIASADAEGTGGGQLLEKLAPRLDEQTLRRALAVARRYPFADKRAKVFAAVGPYVPDSELDDTLREAVAHIREVSRNREEYGGALRKIGEVLNANGRSCARKTLQLLLQAALEPEYRADALKGVLPCLPEDLVGEALARVRELDRIELIPVLVGGRRQEVVEEVLSLLRAVPGSYLDYLLEDLVAYLDRNEQRALVSWLIDTKQAGRMPAKAVRHLDVELAAQLLQAQLVSRSSSPGEGRHDWEPLAQQLAGAPRERTYQVIVDWIESATGERAQFLHEIAMLLPILAALTVPESLADIANAIREIGDWWP
jgi:hypothetical protein